LNNHDAPPNFLRNPNVSQNETIEEKKGWAHSLTQNTPRVRGHVGVPRWD